MLIVCSHANDKQVVYLDGYIVTRPKEYKNFFTFKFSPLPNPQYGDDIYHVKYYKSGLFPSETLFNKSKGDRIKPFGYLSIDPIKAKKIYGYRGLIEIVPTDDTVAELLPPTLESYQKSQNLTLQKQKEEEHQHLI